MLECDLTLVALLGERPRALDQLCAGKGVVGQFTRLLEGPPRILGRRQRRRALARPRQPLECARLDLGGVVRVLVRPERIEVMGGDHLGDLVGIDARLRCEILGRMEVLRLAVVA